MDGEETVRRAFSGTFTKRHGHVTSRSHFRLKTKDLLYVTKEILQYFRLNHLSKKNLEQTLRN
jgi:hypothetical protein